MKVFTAAVVLLAVCTGAFSQRQHFRFVSPEVFEKYIDPYVPSADKFTKEDLTELQKALRAMIDENPKLMAAWVQQSFHDCFGRSGCNGCLDADHPANRGLRDTIADSKALYNQLSPKISFADFVALLGAEGAKAGAEAAEGSLNLPFSIGRPDCVRPLSDTGLPSGFQTNTIQLLRQQFKLTKREAVALIGAHSLGRATTNNTGFNGPWDRSPTKLDSGYYRAMVGLDWEVEKLDNARVKSSQWSASGFMMLHADMILLKKFRTSGEFDEPNCTFETCPEQKSTADIVREFADQQTFHTVFSRAFLKMINKSNGALTRVQ